MAILLSKALGYQPLIEVYFDVLQFNLSDLVKTIHSKALNNEVNLNYNGDFINKSLHETTSLYNIETLIEVFAKAKGKNLYYVNLDTQNK